MSTQLKGTECLSGYVDMVSYTGSGDEGNCVQLTFPTPAPAQGLPENGFWYMQMTRSQAIDLASALIEYANDRRDVIGVE